MVRRDHEKKIMESAGKREDHNHSVKGVEEEEIPAILAARKGGYSEEAPPEDAANGEK